MTKTTEESILAYSSQGLGVYNSREDVQRRRKPRAQLNHTWETKTASKKWGGAKSPQSQLPPDNASSTKVPCPPQTSPLTGDQGFKYMSLWRTFLTQTTTHIMHLLNAWKVTLAIAL